jgi:type II secretory pathway component GspD/PulD (secretin)
MTRIWIGLAVVLWLGAYAVGADNPSQGQQQSPPAATTPAAKTIDVPLATFARTAGSASVEPVPVVPEKDGDHRHTRVVRRLIAVPAAQLADTINSLLCAEGQMARSDSSPSVVIVPDLVSNSLVIGGPTEAVDVVQQLVSKLDHAAAMIRLDVVVGEVPAAKTDPGAPAAPRPEDIQQQMDVLIQAQLTALDNQPASLHVGRREPRITSSAITQQGRTNSFVLENVGTILGFTPHVGPDGTVTLQLNVEDSRLGPMEEGVVVAAPTQGEALRTQNVDTLTVKTTLHIPDGQTAVVGGMARQPKAGKQRVILITPHVLPLSGKAKPGK